MQLTKRTVERFSLKSVADVGGKIAQFSARLLDGVVKKLADQFFVNLARN
jgi:carbon monoxide dehydrogenase subunit G